MVAVVSRAISTVASLFDRSFDPATARKLPMTSAAGESTVRGLYLVGEIAGTPLIKLGLNRGRAAIDHIARNDLGERCRCPRPPPGPKYAAGRPAGPQ